MKFDELYESIMKDKLTNEGLLRKIVKKFGKKKFLDPVGDNIDRLEGIAGGKQRKLPGPLGRTEKPRRRGLRPPKASDRYAPKKTKPASTGPFDHQRIKGHDRPVQEGLLGKLAKKFGKKLPTPRPVTTPELPRVDINRAERIGYAGPKMTLKNPAIAKRLGQQADHAITKGGDANPLKVHGMQSKHELYDQKLRIADLMRGTDKSRIAGAPGSKDTLRKIKKPGTDFDAGYQKVLRHPINIPNYKDPLK
jgi:hypothetical protein